MPTDIELQLLTHYALGELPPARLPEVERLLATDPAAREWVEEVRSTATALSEGLGREAAATAGLDAARKAAISVQATTQPSTPPARRLRFRPWLVVVSGLAAAGLALALILPGIAQARRGSIHPQPVVASRSADGDKRLSLPPVGSMCPLTREEAQDEWPQDAQEFDQPESGKAPLIAQANDSDSLSAVPKGREEAVTDSDLGGSESFLNGRSDNGVLRNRFQGTAQGKISIQPSVVAPSSAPVPAADGLVTAARVNGATSRNGGGKENPLAESADRRALYMENAGGYEVPPQPQVGGGIYAPSTAGESYAKVVESSFQDPQVAPLSTFGLDVDTAAYANVRRFLDQGRLPPPEAVRIEEMLNAFTYADPPPPAGSDRPFAIRVDLATCPWAPAHRLARIAVKAMEVERGQRPPCNLVFLIDVSGSMGEPKKLTLVKSSLAMLTSQLRADDRVAIVTYSDTTRIALASTSGREREAIVDAVNALAANGSTNGAAGIQLAYLTAQANAVAGVNRVILCTDGDFNVGVQSPQELRNLIEEKRKSGVTLTVLGYGMGNLKDANLQILADKGNGTYAYIDSEEEARKALVEQLDSHLVMVAKDAKVQVEFNPARVASWRLIGYEKRQLRTQDFANDSVDSGDIGAGAHVVALYELETRPSPIAVPEDGLRYQGAAIAQEERWDAEVMFVKLRWKRPDLDRSDLIRFPVVDRNESYRGSSADFRFSAAVAAFGLVLRDSPNRGAASLPLVDELARSSLGVDADGRRAEFLRLVRRAVELAPGR